MDAYIDIAIEILRLEKRPLGPRAILAAAYRRGLVPYHLHGKTQHKTLQARLSEDIIARRERSTFFRTAPGRFFLTEFLTDSSIPEEFRIPIATRRRVRELVQGSILAIEARRLKSIAEHNVPIAPEEILGILKDKGDRYQNSRERNRDLVPIRSFVCVCRTTEVLTYRLGRYRDERDSFISHRCLGFASLVQADDRSLFSIDDFGIVDSGVRTTKIDLDFPIIPSSQDAEAASLINFIWAFDKKKSTNDLLALIRFPCPTWFEPIKRRLALNDLMWMDASRPPNNARDFDPWSRAILNTYSFRAR